MSTNSINHQGPFGVTRTDRRKIKAHMMTMPRAERRRIRRGRCTVARRVRAGAVWSKVEEAIERLISAHDAVSFSGPVAPARVMAQWREGRP